LETNLSSFVADFIATKKTEGRSVKTLDWYGWLLGKFCEATGDPPLSGFTLNLVRGFVAELQSRDSRTACSQASCRAVTRAEALVEFVTSFRSLNRVPAAQLTHGGMR